MGERGRKAGELCICQWSLLWTTTSDSSISSMAVIHNTDLCQNFKFNSWRCGRRRLNLKFCQMLSSTTTANVTLAKRITLVIFLKPELIWIFFIPKTLFRKTLVVNGEKQLAVELNEANILRSTHPKSFDAQLFRFLNHLSGNEHTGLYMILSLSLCLCLCFSKKFPRFLFPGKLLP